MLAGKLQHACKVVTPGRAFLRRVFELLAAVRADHHHIRQNSSFRSEFGWGTRSGNGSTFYSASGELGGIIIGIAPCSGQEAGVAGMLR